ncbi:MAG: hypothetical protein JHC33_14550 [Ignisphaera sp.]|nr:hypothetical protein [Ignisphaera sp.]
MDTNLNPVETTVELQPTSEELTTPGNIPTEILASEELTTPGNIPTEILASEELTTPGNIPSLDNLSDEQKSQLKEFQRRMELYNKSRSGHQEGDTHKMSDGVSYLVTKSGAYNRIGAPRKSRKATHRKEVASRRSGKS